MKTFNEYYNARYRGNTPDTCGYIMYELYALQINGFDHYFLEDQEQNQISKEEKEIHEWITKHHIP